MSNTTELDLRRITEETLRSTLDELGYSHKSYCVAAPHLNPRVGAGQAQESTAAAALSLKLNAVVSPDWAQPIALQWEPLFAPTGNNSALSQKPADSSTRSFRELSKVICLTPPAWRDCQLIPFKSLYKFFLPPLVFPETKASGKQILLVDHGVDKKLINDIGDALHSRNFEPIIWSMRTLDDVAITDELGCGKDIFAPTIHVHVGAHSKYWSPIRIIDSWASGRCVIQHVDTDQWTPWFTPLQVTNGLTGFATRSIEELLFVARSLEPLEPGRILRERIISASINESAKLKKKWRETMKDLLK